HRVGARHRLDGARQPDDRVQLIDVAVRVDARMVLRHASAAEQTGVASVARPGIDLHRAGECTVCFSCRLSVVGGPFLSRTTENRRPRTETGISHYHYRMRQEPRDITIIGGGPTGLFALFYAGMRKATAQIVDALPEVGGQLTALYPEKY